MVVAVEAADEAVLVGVDGHRDVRAAGVLAVGDRVGGVDLRVVVEARAAVDDVGLACCVEGVERVVVAATEQLSRRARR